MEHSFPSGFSENITKITNGLGRLGDAALAMLHDKGYMFATGLTERYAGQIGAMCTQEHIREYCPKDSTESRFASLESTERWLKKGGGRAVFLLLTVDELLAGYGWTGHAPCEQLPNHPITSAYRIGELAVGQGLGKPFVQAVVSGTNVMYAPGHGIGLETWQSNPAASLYPKVGFELVNAAEREEYRPTLDPAIDTGMVPDRRLYMDYARDLG